MKYLILYFCFSLSMVLYGQDAKSDFKKINEVYTNTNAFAMDVKYELFLDGNLTAHEIEKGRYIKNGKKYYTKQAQNEIVITDQYMFLIDGNTRILAVDKKIDDNRIANPLSLSLDSLFILYSKIELISNNSNSIKGYRFYIKEGPYISCDVYFDAKTYFVTEIKNVFREKLSDENNKKRSAVLKTTFYNLDQNLSAFSLVFDNTKYIKKIKDKYLLGDSYKSYKLINHLN